MKLLVLGVSSIFRRRVLPGLARAGITALDVCSRSGVACQAPEGMPVRRFADYDEALAQSDARAVYVSTHNALHARLVFAALERGFHVAVDKPAFADADQADAALALAGERGLVLAEANVWAHHPRARALAELFGRGSTRLHAAFSFPPLPGDNYRLDKALGGGALLDLGPYAVSPGRLLFGCSPVSVSCEVLSRAQNPDGSPGVETAFACLLVYPGGRSLTGVFGFDTGYVNTLLALGPGAAAHMDRAFTPGPDQELTLDLNTPGGASTRRFEAADTFGLFFRRFADAVRMGDGAAFAADLQLDTRALAALRRAADAKETPAPAGP